MPDNSNIILVGPMGAGKSAVGRQLAAALNREFHDSDHDIVARTGVDISFIFEKEGEEGFRKRETEVIEHLCQKQNILLSTGGGSVVKTQNRDIISRSGFVIYLHATVKQQVKRTKKTDNRPLLQADDPEKILTRLMQEREHFYRDVADLVIITDGQKVTTVVDKIQQAMQKIKEQQAFDYKKFINVRTISRSYKVEVVAQSIPEFESFALLSESSLVVVTDENLDTLYRKHLESKLNPLAWLVIPAAETSKSFDHYQWILSELQKLGVKRDATLLGLGGGVVGDLTGFVAATYMRGMRLVHMPTSLLAMVDSSIGGKTGINLPEGKNLVGSIYQPHAVITNLSFLKTLPEREYVSGLAEVVKYGLLYDEELLQKIENNTEAITKRDLCVLSEIVARCIEIKAEIVEKDEQDHGLRMLLNLGHTFGHAIETLQAYQGFKHGEAVGIGMCMAARLSEALGNIDSAEVKRIENLCKQLGLPVTWSNFKTEEFLQAMSGDKKNTATSQRFILLKSIGHAYVEESVTKSQLEKLLNAYQVNSSPRRQTA